MLTAACSVYWQWLLQPLIALGTQSVQCSHDPSTLPWLLYHAGYHGARMCCVTVQHAGYMSRVTEQQ